jgi:spore coat protein U-like protein
MMMMHERTRGSHPAGASATASRARLRAFAWLLAITAALVAMPSHAATCNLSTQGVNFGSYDFLSSQNLDSVGHIVVTCDTSTSYTIGLSPGNGSYIARLMTNGPHQLAYNLYTDATQTMVWGDGSSGTAVVGGTGTDVDHTVYGSAPAGQNPYVGSYSDAITVTLTF